MPYATTLLVICLTVSPPSPASNAASESPAASRPLPSALAERATSRYAGLVHRAYADSLDAARTMRDAITEMLASPSEASLRAAREAWVRARLVYGRTEAFRFYGGPIDGRRDGVETLVNAWPLDEGFIDAVEGRPDAGIVNDATRYPVIDAAILELLNQRGGETQVATGWHAIEFLLWGQDLDPVGPGGRPHTDFVAGIGRNAERRREYLEAVTALLLRHLAGLRDAWAPDGQNYRRDFEADPQDALRRMLTGVTLLAGFEMSGERLAVAIETRDQEEEHSCFSDTTHVDFIANMRGIEDIHGGPDGLGAVARAIDESLAARLDRAIERSTRAIAAIPPPFDAAMRGEDGTPGRAALREAMESLEALAALYSEVALRLGHRLPVEPEL